MNNELKPYDEYKSTNLIWVDKIPRHWNIVGNREIWRQRNERKCTEVELLSVTIKKGVIMQKELLSNTSKKDTSNLDKSKYKLVMPNDIAYNKMRMWQGAVGKSNYKGIVSPAHIILKPIKNLNMDYYHYLLRTAEYTEESHRYSYGICDDQMNLRYEDFKRMNIIEPPKDEQDKIVKYLDIKLSKINKFIRENKRLMDTLKEQIESYIYGNDCKNKELIIKSWEGAFPKGWALVKAGRIFKERIEKNHVDKELLAVTQDRGVLLKKDCEQKYVSPSSDLTGLKLVKESDYVISLRSFQGGIEYSKIEGIVSPAYNVFYLRSQYNNEMYEMYYKYLFKSKIFIGVLNTIVSGIRDGKNISYTDFSSILVAMPQQESLEKIYHLIQKYEKIKEQFEKEKQLVLEYRTRLISDVVRGKVDIRNIVIDEKVEEDVETDDEMIEELDEVENDTDETSED